MDRSATLAIGDSSRMATHRVRWGEGRALYMLKYLRSECTPMVPWQLLEDGKPFVVHLRCTIADNWMHFPPAIDCEYWLCVLAGNVRHLGHSGRGRRRKAT